jgi:hypothetical protein
MNVTIRMPTGFRNNFEVMAPPFHETRTEAPGKQCATPVTRQMADFGRQ